MNVAVQALQDMDTDTLRRLLGNVNLPSWVNFPGVHLRHTAHMGDHALSAAAAWGGI